MSHRRIVNNWPLELGTSATDTEDPHIRLVSSISFSLSCRNVLTVDEPRDFGRHRRCVILGFILSSPPQKSQLDSQPGTSRQVRHSGAAALLLALGGRSTASHRRYE